MADKYFIQWRTFKGSTCESGWTLCAILKDEELSEEWRGAGSVYTATSVDNNITIYLKYFRQHVNTHRYTQSTYLHPCSLNSHKLDCPPFVWNSYLNFREKDEKGPWVSSCLVKGKERAWLNLMLNISYIPSSLPALTSSFPCCNISNHIFSIKKIPLFLWCMKEKNYNYLSRSLTSSMRC